MSGAFSTVHKKFFGAQAVAVKTYSKTQGKEVQRHYQREIWALRTLAFDSEAAAKEQHIIYLFTADSDNDNYYLTFPFYERTLSDFLDCKNSLIAHSCLAQLARGLHFLHSEGIIHCDISPSNILMDNDNHMVISDFGCAHSNSAQQRYADEDETTEIGTRYYKAPEHLFGYRVYTPATDVWSLGTIFCRLLLGYPIFAGESDLEQIGFIVRRLGRPPASVIKEEMQQYPDVNKLIFFTDHSEEGDTSEEFTEDAMSTDEELEIPNVKRKRVSSIFKEECIPADDLALARRMLTWSVKNRIDTQALIEYCDKNGWK